jgi:hypothetical protein
MLALRASELQVADRHELLVYECARAQTGGHEQVNHRLGLQPGAYKGVW